MFYRSQLPITDNPRSSNLTTPISPNAGLQEVPTRERSYEVPLDDNVIRYKAPKYYIFFKKIIYQIIFIIFKYILKGL